jgi:hypothetical protein
MSSRIRDNIEHLKILGKEKKMQQATSLLKINSYQELDDAANNTSESEKKSEESNLGVEESIARIEE